MQKKIIALAIAAAISTPAFAETTVYGIVDAAVARIAGAGQQSDTQVLSGGLSTSRVGFKNVSDIDGGLKAVVVLEYALNTAQSAINTTAGATQNNSGVGAARQQMVALAGDFGTAAAGYLQTTGYDFGVKYDPTAGSTISPLGNVTKGGQFLIGTVATGARASRALAYISPKLGGTTTLAANFSTGMADSLGNLNVANNVASTKIDAYLLSANYDGGALQVGGVYAKLNNKATVSAVANTTVALADAKEYSLGGSYDFGVAKAFATYQSRTALGASADKAQSIGAVIPAGPGAVILSYASNKRATVNTSARGETIAYAQDLSKTVTAYVGYTRMSQDTGTAAYSVANNVVSTATLTAGGSSSMFATGLRVKF
jgi:predicted porin